MSFPRSGHTPFARLSLLTQATVIGMGLLGLGLSWLLLPAWRSDPDLAHGLAVPVMIGILFYESRRDRGRFVPASWALSAAFFMLLVLGLLGIACGGLYAAALGVDHAMARFLASLGFGLLLLAGWLGLSDSRVRFVSWGWPAVVAALLCPLASPLPPGSYLKLSLALQGSVTEVVTQTLRHVGIAAYREGNVIELARTSVGVSEACSGVRSLISCLAAGLFFSGLWVRRLWARIAVVVLSPLIGLGMNVVRSLILTLAANRGIDIAAGWHDATGAAIIIVTSVAVGALSWALRSEYEPTVAESRVPLQTVPGAVHPVALSLGLLSIAVFVVGLAAASRPVDASHVVAPDLSALFPAAPDGWSVETERDLDQFSDVLKTSTLVRRIYTRGVGKGVEHVTLYVAYWKPGQAPVSVVSAHTPDACWPSSGWVLTPGSAAYLPLSVDGRTLPPAEARLFEHNGYTTHVWYWHLYGGHALEHNNVYSVTGLLELSLAYGFRRGGDQLFVLVSSNHPWESVSREGFVRRFFERVGPLGL